MDILDPLGHVSRTPEVVDRLLDLVRREPALVRFVSPVAEVIPWGATGMYFAGTWEPAQLPALLKVNVSEAQRFWSAAVSQRDPDLAPQVFASGERLAGVDLGWILLERLPGGLHEGWHGAEFGLLADAGARFQKLAASIPSPPCSVLAESDVRGWIQGGIDRGAPGPAEAVSARLPDDWQFLIRTCGADICHGDLHMANALMRAPAPQIGPALLIDFEPTRMPWVLDAAYAQVLNSDPRRAGWQDLAGQMATFRRAHGLAVCSAEDLRRAARIALGWYALRMWGMIGPAPDATWREPSVWHDQNRAYVEDAATA